MNIFQKLAHWLFGYEYVVLVSFNNNMNVRRAYELGGKVYANPYLSYTRTELLSNGKVFGACYINSWRPITNKTVQFFERAEE